MFTIHYLNSRANGFLITPITFTDSLQSHEYWPLSARQSIVTSYNHWPAILLNPHRRKERKVIVLQTQQPHGSCQRGDDTCQPLTRCYQHPKLGSSLQPMWQGPAQSVSASFLTSCTEEIELRSGIILGSVPSNMLSDRENSKSLLYFKGGMVPVSWFRSAKNFLKLSSELPQRSTKPISSCGELQQLGIVGSLRREWTLKIGCHPTRGYSNFLKRTTVSGIAPANALLLNSILTRLDRKHSAGGIRPDSSL